MIDIEFNYNQIITVVQARLNDIFQDVINKYVQKSLLDPKSIFFFANGKQIEPQENVESQMSDVNKESNKMQILVHLIEQGTIQLKILTKSKDIICSACKEPCRIKIENFKITLFGCIKNHKIENIKLKFFPITQRLNISNIKCDKCHIKNKGNSPNNEFYKCLTCDKNLCLLCKPNHISNHNIINYDNINYICQNHNEHLIKYCKQCYKNICFTCDEEHKNHQTISLAELKPNLEENKKFLIEIKNEIELFNNNTKEIIKQLNDLIDYMNIFYEINNDLLNNYEKQNRNYQILLNINEINTNKQIFNKISYINKTNNNKVKLFNIIELYNNLIDNEIITEKMKEYISLKNPKYQRNNSMTIRYKVYEDDINIKLRLFGDEFVKNNKNNCVIIIDGKTLELTEHIDINENMRKKEYLEIQLKEINTITNMSHMFCRGIEENDKMLVINISDMYKWDTEYVTDMSYLFCCCDELEKIPNISYWNTSNVEDMSNMISYCFKIESLPYLSKWDTRKVKNMSHMFAGNFALKYFPDISNWNTAKVENMEHMFAYSGIYELPDISKWDLSSILNMSYMFSHCGNLKTFPNIYKWKIKNRANLRGMFHSCFDAKFPEKFDISDWDINDQCIVSYMFFYNHNFYHDFNINKRELCDKFKTGLGYFDIWEPKPKYKYEKNSLYFY